jgi:hypothetical protein
MAPQFLTLALAGGEWSTSHPCLFTPAGTCCIGGWVGLSVSPDAMQKKALAPAGNQAPAVHPIACYCVS